MSNDILQQAMAFLRAHHAGELQFDEHLRPVKIVYAPDGRIVGPVMVAMLEAPDTVLFLPHADEEAMQVQVTLEKFADEGSGGDLADRWRIYHGEPPDVNWAFYHIDAAKFQQAVIDGDALTRPNPLTPQEPALCREVNRNRREQLRATTQRRENLEIESPMMVGIDPWGVDVRGPFDVIRIAFDEPVTDADAAERTLMSMLEEGGA